MTTISMLSPLAGVKLQPNRPVIGVDLSTVRASACILERGHGRAPVPRWESKTLKDHAHMAYRVSLAQETIAGWLEWLEAECGPPAAIGLEIPLAGPNTPLVSFWFVGAFISAVGDVYAAAVPLVTMGPGAWKKPATGSGYAPGLPRGASKAAKRKAEKARLMSWARDVMGYPLQASIQDEADATGVAVATALQVAR